MKIIREYSNFKKWTVTPITLNFAGSKIYFDSDKAKELRNVIKEYINTIPEFVGNIYGASKNITIDGKVVDSELISKLPNNISAMYGVLEVSKKSGHLIDNADDFIFWVKNNLKDLYHPSGKFFNDIYVRLTKATNYGKAKELDANTFFTNYAKKIRGIDITLISPSPEEDALGGVDYYFTYNNKKITIQVKTLNELKQEIYNGEKCYVVSISGDLTKIKADYLMLMSQKEGYPSYIFRRVKNDKKIVIDMERSKYIIPEDNLVVNQETMFK